jgi:Transcriptional regulators
MADARTDDALGPEELETYLVLTEAVSMLQYAVEEQLRAAGGLSGVQFQILTRLAFTGGPLTMTELADGIVYSRSGLTYQAGLLEKAGLITRTPSPDDERVTLTAITDEGRARVAQVMPGHVELVRRLFLAPLDERDLRGLREIMTRVRDHMRNRPPRSVVARKRRAAPGAGGSGRGGDGR